MRYFGGKIGLLEALFEDAWVHLNSRVARVVKATSGGRDGLLAAVQTIVTTLSRDPDLATLAMFEGRRIRGEEARIRISRGYTQFAETIRGFVRSAQAAGELDAAFDANAVTSAVLGAMESMVRDRLLAKSGTARNFAEREIRRTIAAMLDGMTPRSAARKR
jgi:AcrR family transcriptional regulator